MTIEEIEAKLKEAKVDDSVVEALKSFADNKEAEKLSKELEAERGKASAILSDKKKYKEKMEALEAKLSEVYKEKLPEEERIKAELQEWKEKFEMVEKERETERAGFTKAQRDAKIADLTSSIHWADGIPHDTAKLIINSALSGLDDLSEVDKVNEVLNSVKETHKSFISAEAPSGSGGKGKNGDNNNGNDFGGAIASSIADNQAEIWGTK